MPDTAVAPAGHATVNPFLIADDASGLERFLVRVFGAEERPEARTLDHDGLLLHAELELGGTTLMLAERKPGWPFSPALLQVYVTDVEATLQVAQQLGAALVTAPTEVFGETFSRLRDPWGNLWWVYGLGRSAEEVASGDGGGDDAADGEAAWTQASPELNYIHDTLLTAMEELRDPRATAP